MLKTNILNICSNYVRNYFETVQAKEEAIRQIEDRIKKTVLIFIKNTGRFHTMR